MARSLEKGERVPVPDDAPPTRCDALQTKLVSPLTFDVLREAGARGVAVTADEIAAAMAFPARHLRLVVETGGAASLAAPPAGQAGRPHDPTPNCLAGGNAHPPPYAAHF